eukprot:4569959-Pyramimonas_sp.AAC.1
MALLTVLDHGRKDLRQQRVPQPVHLLSGAALDVPSEGLARIEAASVLNHGPRGDQVQERLGLRFDAMLKLRPVLDCPSHARHLRIRWQIDLVFLKALRERLEILCRCSKPALLGC